jgi:hypothetical protein
MGRRTVEADVIDRSDELVCPVCYMGNLDYGRHPNIMRDWENYHDAHCWGRWHIELQVRVPQWELDLLELRRRINRWIDVAAEQATNLMRYGTQDPTGGNGRQQYTIAHPMFPRSI